MDSKLGKFCESLTSAETSKSTSSDFNFYYQIDDSFYSEIEINLSIIKLILTEIKKYEHILEQDSVASLTIEVEYARFMMNYLIPLLQAYKNTEDDLKDNMLKLDQFLTEQFEILSAKYGGMNKFYFSQNELMLFRQAAAIFLERETLKVSKSGLTYLRYLTYYLNKLLTKLTELSQYDYNSIDSKEVFKLAYKNSKVKFLSQIIYFYLAPKEMSLFELKTNHPRWLKIFENTEVISVSDFPTGKKHINFSYFFTNFMHALYYTIEFDKFNTFNPLHAAKFIFFAAFYWLRPGLAKHLRKFYSLRCNVDIIKCVFESLEHKLLNKVYTFNLARIVQNEIRYLNRSDRNDLNIYSGKGFKDPNYIQFRVISNNKIEIVEKPPKKMITELRNFFGLMLKISKDILLPCYDVIFFVHGGGFFAQTSESHQNYLINWSKNLNAVVFCIDYKLAPESKYPNIVDENLEAYERIVSNCEKMFRFRIKKLSVVGDSGGGFMILNVIKHAIRKGLKVPDAACLIYPCSRIIYDWMSPSLLMATRDNFIDPGLMANIQSVFLDLTSKSIEEYRKDDRLNFFLTDTQTLSKFPKTLIVSGTFDPLRDECYLLADLLLQNNVDVKFREYLFFCHGFFNLSNAIDPYYKKGEEDVEAFFREVFTSTN